MRRNVFGILAAGFGLTARIGALVSASFVCRRVRQQETHQDHGHRDKGGMDEPPHLLLCRCKRRQAKGNELRVEGGTPPNTLAETDGERIH